MFDIDSTLVRLLCKFESFGKTVAQADIYEEELIKTADTDGVDIRYNPMFAKSLKEDERIFLFAHEILHIILEHIPRSIGKDPEIWNIAADAIINAFLVEAGLPMIKGGINIPEAINYDCEELYDYMLAIKEKMDFEQNAKSSSGGENKESATGNGSSDGENKESATGNGAASGNNQNGPGSVEKDGESGAAENEESFEEKIRKAISNSRENHTPTGIDDHSGWEEAAKNLPPIPEGEIREKDFFDDLLKEINQSASDYTKHLADEAVDGVGQGHGALGANRKVQKIPSATHIIPWQDVLRDAIRYEEDYTRKYPRVRDGFFRYRITEIPILTTEIVLDTSGSISNQTLINFLRECKSIFKYSKIKVGCFDDVFYGFTELRNPNEIETMKYKGGGGTNFDAAVNAFSNDASAKIIFTDGEGDMPRKKLDAVWVVMGSKKINPKGGKVIYITGRQLEILKRLKTDFEQENEDLELDEQ